MRIILIGPPGSGKGTQAKRLASHFHIPHISTGDILRAAKDTGSDLGKTAASYMDKGRLVPDKIVVGLMQERLSQADCQRGCLLDGFPRTVPQAQALDEHFAREGIALDGALELSVPNDILLERLAGRLKESSRPRVDDDPETIQERLEVFRTLTSPLLEYYQRQGLLCSIDGLGTPDAVFSRILAALEKRSQP